MTTATLGTETFVIIRHDSNADGGQRLSELIVGTVAARNHRTAVAFAHDTFIRSDMQWIEAVNVKRARRGQVSCATRLPSYIAD